MGDEEGHGGGLNAEDETELEDEDDDDEDDNEESDSRWIIYQTTSANSSTSFTLFFQFSYLVM